MNLPLRVERKIVGGCAGVPIADASNRILCIVPNATDARAIAENIVKAVNQPRWWHRFRINKPYTRSDWEWKRPWWATPDYVKPQPKSRWVSHGLEKCGP